MIILQKSPISHISIHAPREGGDTIVKSGLRGMSNFNPRPPRGGRLQHLTKMWRKAYFNPRPPRGGRPI